MLDIRALKFCDRIYTDASNKNFVLTASLKVPTDSDVSQLDVIVKAKACQNWEESVKGLEELTMSSAKHPNICDMYGYCFHTFPNEGISRLLIVLERLECDLEKEAKVRLAQGRYYTEGELLEMLWQFTDALAFMQSQGRVHRDLKPQNLFIAKNGTYKISDFGSSKLDISRLSNELQGSPLFLSPKMKQVFYTFLSTNVLEAPNDDKFKSDVYSLGVTFVFLCLLDTPVSLITITDLEKELTKLIHTLSIRYTWLLMKYIFLMMKINESERPDFLQLKAMMQSDNEAFPTHTLKMTSEERLQKELEGFESLEEEGKKRLFREVFGHRELTMYANVKVFCCFCGSESQGQVFGCQWHFACAAHQGQMCSTCQQTAVCSTCNYQLQRYEGFWYCSRCNLNYGY